MKKTRIHRVWILFLLGIMACLQVRAQYMPVVFDTPCFQSLLLSCSLG